MDLHPTRFHAAGTRRTETTMKTRLRDLSLHNPGIRIFWQVLAITAWLLGGRTSLKAEVTLSHIIAEHMVLQRDRPVHLWGRANPGERVAITFRGHAAESTADSLGRWSVYLPPGNAGGPFSLSIQATNRIDFTDILVGDLWLASGQSNMEFPMAPAPPWTTGVRNAKSEIAAADDPKLRLFQVKDAWSDYPKDDLDAKRTWTACTPRSIAGFSAVAYFFGRELLEKEKVPIGLIEADVGGTPAEAWTSLDALTSDPSLMPVFSARAHMINDESTVLLEQEQEKVEADKAQAQGRTPTAPAWRPDPTTWSPAALFNAMIAPLTPLALRGVVWYQGESNTDRERAPLYATLFPALIKDWRAHWALGNFPFLFVQIANYNSSDDWPTVRDAQRRTLSVANTGMAVTIDIGDAAMIHPQDKQDVGHRLALWARAISYGEPVENSGPLFRQATPDGAQVRVWFDHSGGGLVAKGDVLRGFEVAGPDKAFVPANAAIEGNSVHVASSRVAQPLYVRYGWAAAPDGNLYNREGLPASPFTSVP